MATKPIPWQPAISCGSLGGCARNRETRDGLPDRRRSYALGCILLVSMRVRGSDFAKFDTERPAKLAYPTSSDRFDNHFTLSLAHKGLQEPLLHS